MYQHIAYQSENKSDSMFVCPMDSFVIFLYVAGRQYQIQSEVQMSESSFAAALGLDVLGNRPHAKDLFLQKGFDPYNYCFFKSWPQEQN